MTITSFEDIIAWQKAKELTLLVYRNFNTLKDFGYRDQIQRASISIMNNVAEGYERQGDREFKRFLYMAKGSAAEVRSMLSIATDLGYGEEGKIKTMNLLSLEVSRLLSGLIKTL